MGVSLPEWCYLFRTPKTMGPKGNPYAVHSWTEPLHQHRQEAGCRPVMCPVGASGFPAINRIVKPHG